MLNRISCQSNTTHSWLKSLCLVAFVGLISSVALAGALTAQAQIKGCDAKSGIRGAAKLSEQESEEGVKLVDIEIRVKGMIPGKHAVHIHEVGTCSPCGAAKGHFDPGPESNSSPDGNHPFHMGDLINLMVDDKGNGMLKTTTNRVTLSPGPLSLFDDNGSSFIIHVNKDTYCPGGEAKGCAGGSRAACGIIKLRGDHEDNAQTRPKTRSSGY
jgi:Cu-Zn family superoxide dismutase